MGGTGDVDTGTSSGPSCTPGIFTLGGLPVSRFSDNPSSIAVADLDGDGKADLVATLANANKVAIILGRGDGSLARTLELDPGGQPGVAAIGDLNGDGRNDLAVALTDSVSVLLNQGGGGFASRVEYPVQKNPGHMVLADVNGDGHRDLAVTSADSSFVSVLLNRGDGSFAAATKHEVGGVALALAAGDLNGDGRDDLAVALGGKAESVILLFGASDGTFSARTIDSFANAVVIGELDGDGKPDLALSTGRAVRVLLNQGGGSFSAPVDYPAGPVDACFGHALVMGDTNRDGRADLALLNDDCENVTFLRNRGDGRFADAEVFWVGTYPWLLAFGDLNRDRRDDLVFVSDYLQPTVLPAQPDGGFVSDYFPVTPLLTHSSVLGDVDGDGRLDLVFGVGDEHLIEVRLGQADATFAVGSRYASKGKPNALAVADVSGDGRKDLIYWDYSGAMGVLLRQRDGSFSSPVETKLGGWPSSCLFRDLDGDGDADLLLIPSSASKVDVRLSQGDGTFLAKTGYAVSNRPNFIAVGDFNADGKPDLGYVDLQPNLLQPNEIGIALGQGDGTFAPGMRRLIEGVPAGLTVGDVNGDAIMDLIVTGSTPSEISVFLGGPGLLGPWRDTTVDFHVETVLGIGDVDLDGRADLAVVQGGAMLFIVLGQGDGSFGENLGYGIIHGGPMVLADLTGDGRLDVGVVEEVDGVAQWNVYRNTLCR